MGRDGLGQMRCVARDQVDRLLLAAAGQERAADDPVVLVSKIKLLMSG